MVTALWPFKFLEGVLERVTTSVANTKTMRDVIVHTKPMIDMLKLLEIEIHSDYPCYVTVVDKFTAIITVQLAQQSFCLFQR